MAQNDIVIIGGGISGLSLALYCEKAGLKTLLLEKEVRVGGSFHSHRIQDDGDVFWIELGAHTCYNSYRNLLDIVDGCQIAGQMVPREKVPWTMLIDGRIESIFSQINYPELIASLPNLFFQKKDGHSVASYYSKVIGNRNYQNVFKHLFNAVPSQYADEFPADILFKKRSRRKDVLKSYSFERGLQTIVDAISTRNGIQIQTDKETESIELVNGNYCVTTHDGCEYEARNLALATPSFVTAKLLQPAYPEISRDLSKLLTAKIYTVGIILQRKFVSQKPVAGIVSPDDLFYSIVSRDIVKDNKYRGFTFHFKPDIRDHSVRLKRITEVLDVKSSRIDHIETKLNLLPALRVGHNQLIEKIDKFLAGKRLLLTGNYFAGISIEDCVSRSVSEFSRLESLDNENAAGGQR